MPVRVLGRAGPPAAALALRRRADVAPAHDRAHPRARRGGEAGGRRADAAAPARDADPPRALSAARARRSRPAARSSRPGCHAPDAEAALLRRLRVRTMVGGLLDDPELIAAAAADVGDRAGRARRVVRARTRSRTRCRRTSAPPAPRHPPRARWTTSSAARPRSAATRRRATSCGATTAWASRSPASTRSRRTRRRSPTSRRTCRAAPRRSPSRRCSRGPASRWRRPRSRSSQACSIEKAREELTAVADPQPAGADCYWVAA